MRGMATPNIRDIKQPLADEVFLYIGRQIIDGVMPARHRIRDVEVAEELHVSRTPVREALQRLERHGLVVMYPSRYTEVTAITPEIIAQYREFAGYQAGIAARMGVARIPESQRLHLAELVDEMRAALDHEERVIESRWAVFAFLASHSGNTALSALLEDTTVALYRNLRDWRVPIRDRTRMRGVYDDFREAALSGDADAAERLARIMYYV